MSRDPHTQRARPQGAGPQRRLAAIAKRQGGCFTRQQALALGWSGSMIDRRIRAGVWVVVHAGVYRDATLRPDWPLRLQAALLAAGPTAVVSHRSAARLWHLPGFDQSQQLDLLVASHKSRQVDSVTIHLTRWLPDQQATTIGGLPVTSLDRTVHGLGRYLNEPRLLKVAVDVCRKRRTTPDALAYCAAQLAGARGTGRLRTVLAELDPKCLDVWSGYELRMHLCLRSGPDPSYVLNYRTTLSSGRQVVFDVAWPSLFAAMECDSETYHSLAYDVRRDLARDRDSDADGWLVERVPAALLDKPSEVRARAEDLLVRARARLLNIA